MSPKKPKNEKFKLSLKAFDLAIKSLEEAYITVSQSKEVPDIQAIAAYEEYLSSFETNTLAICDDVLDQYNKKKINKKQLKEMMSRHEKMDELCKKIRDYIEKNWQ